jgi:hypothetical protein
LNLRELFIQWLTASRFIQSLETRIHEQRQDFTERLADKDAQIKQLRIDLATMKMERDRASAALPQGLNLAPRPAPPVLPAFTGPDSWDAELNRLYEEQEKANGTHGTGREEVHEPTADDGSQPLDGA